MIGTGIAGLKVEDKQAYIALELAVRRKLEQRAVAQEIATPDELVIRDILPNTDLSLTSETWRYDGSAATINSYTQVVANVDLDKKKLIAFFGVKKRESDVVSVVQFKRGDAEVIDNWQIEALEPDEATIVNSAEEAIIYDAQDKVNIYYYFVEQGVSRLVLLGKVAEKKGQTVEGTSAQARRVA